MERTKCTPSENRFPLPDSLRTTLSEWIMRNFNMPSDASTLIVFMVLIFLTWYIINWTVKLLLSLMWPIFIITGLILLLPYIRGGNFGDVLPNVKETGKEVYLKLGAILSQFAKSIGQFVRCPAS